MEVPLPEEKFAEGLAKVQEFYDGTIEIQWYPRSAKIAIVVTDDYGRKRVIRGPVDKALEELYRTCPVPISRALDWARKNNGRAGGNGAPAPEGATTPTPENGASTLTPGNGKGSKGDAASQDPAQT